MMTGKVSTSDVRVVLQSVFIIKQCHDATVNEAKRTELYELMSKLEKLTVKLNAISCQGILDFTFLHHKPN